MSDPIAFLRARLDEDEFHAKTAQLRGPGPWTHEPATGVGLPGAEDLHDAIGDAVAVVRGGYLAEFLVRHDPARELREVEAGRRLLDAYDDAVNGPNADLGVADALEAAIRDRAGAYPDYPADWTP